MYSRKWGRKERMTTIGGLFDQLCILERRMKEYKYLAKDETELKKQRGWIIIEIARVLNDIVTNKRPATFSKNKLYDQDVTQIESDSLLVQIQELNNQTFYLWDLEDKRRDKTQKDEVRLSAADLVAVHNKRRNLAIDAIDEIIQKSLDSIKEIKNE